MNESNRTRQREWLSLVLPWASIVGVAIVAAALVLANPSSCDDDNDNLANNYDNDVRQLYEDDGYVPPAGDYSSRQGYPPSSSMEINEEHHHKPVYNEEHPPLFPLTSRDYVGFFLAVLGLMVAVSDINTSSVCY